MRPIRYAATQLPAIGPNVAWVYSLAMGKALGARCAGSIRHLDASVRWVAACLFAVVLASCGVSSTQAGEVSVTAPEDVATETVDEIVEVFLGEQGAVLAGNFEEAFEFSSRACQPELTLDAYTVFMNDNAVAFSEAMGSLPEDITFDVIEIVELDGQRATVHARAVGEPFTAGRLSTVAVDLAFEDGQWRSSNGCAAVQ